MASRFRRANNNSVTFRRTGPTSTLGDKTKTFGLRMNVQGGRGRGKTIQTSEVNRNNMGQAACCVGQPPPPPCPEPKEPLVCPPPGGTSATLSLCTRFTDLALFPTQSFGPNGGSISLLPGGGVRLSAKPAIPPTAINFAQLLSAGPVVNPSTARFCICFDVHDTLVDSTRGWVIGLAENATGFPTARVVGVTPVVPPMGGPGFRVLFFGLAFFAGPIIPAATVSGLHKFQVCGNETPGTFSLQVDGGTPLSFIPLPAAVPAVSIPASILANTVPPTSPGPSIIEVGSYCLQAG